MKKKFLRISIAVLGMGLLGACSNSDLDDLEKRVDVIESKSIASINDQIKGINASIADLGTIRKDILDLQVAVGAKGSDISELQAADAALGKRIDELKEYVGDLSKYADKDWVNATFATLEQHRKTVGDLKAIDEKVGNLDARLTKAIKDVSDNLNATIKDLSDRVSALEAMIQSVSIVPAYDDGSVEANGDILTINFVVSPASAAASLTKDSINVLVNEVKTRGASYTTLAAESAEVDPVTGDVTITADISGCTPAEGKSLTAAVKVKNGISNYTTEFVKVIVTGPDLPEGALPGVFSVSATKKVHFSNGNLQATHSTTTSAYTWGFAANQYDYIGNAVGNTTIDTQTDGAVVDLLGWSTSSSNYGICTATSGGTYFGDFVDWGKAYCGQKGLADDTWRTLTADDWTYLFNTRTVNGNIKEGHSYQRAYINSTGTENSGVYGMILYPDNYTSQTAATSYTSTEWAAMEAAGCVFLPAAGSRYGSIVQNVGVRGYYWTSSGDDLSGAFYVTFEDGNVSPSTLNFRIFGVSVRLVTEVPAAPAPYSFSGGFASEGYGGK